MAIVPDLSGNNRGHTSGIPATDPHVSFIDSVRRSYTVTPSDTTDLPNGGCEAIMVAVAGNLKVTYVSGIIDTIGAAAGIWLPMNVKRIWATGTSATGINAGY